VRAALFTHALLRFFFTTFLLEGAKLQAAHSHWMVEHNVKGSKLQRGGAPRGRPLSWPFMVCSD
jgi:hypothetical protein